MTTLKLVVDTDKLRTEDLNEKMLELERHEGLPLSSGSFAMINDALKKKVKVYRLEWSSEESSKEIPEIDFL